MTMVRGSNLEVRIVAKGKDPNNLIDHAPHLLNQDSADARRDGAPHDIYDQAWVVTDVDEFADQLRTLRRQKRERLDLIISNPCFEVWLVLHLDANPKSEGKAVREQARQLGLVTGPGNKAPVLGKLDGFFDVARGRAEKLRQRHDRDGQRFPHDAPSTQVDLAVAQIRAAASAL
jgi:hypothetical protein